MPTTEQILTGLKEIANAWRALAVVWHIYFGALAIALLAGARPSKRFSGILLALPLLSVSIVAWISVNPFNGIVFALVGLVLIYVSVKLPRDRVEIAPVWALIAGICMFVFGWVYPHFLDTSSFFSYLYASPTGLIPCATLSIVIGLALLLNGLDSRALSLILGITGLFYGLTGVAQLGVSIDVVLALGSAIIVVLPFAGRPRVQVNEAATQSEKN